MKFLTGLTRFFKFKRGASKTEPVSDALSNEERNDSEQQESAEIDTLETPPALDVENDSAQPLSQEPAKSLDAAETPPASGNAAQKRAGKAPKFRHTKTLLVAVAVVVLVLSTLAGLKFLFSGNINEPKDEPEAQITLTDVDKSLFQAVRDDDLKEVLRCLFEGGRVDAVNEFGVTPFKAAIALNRIDMVREFIEAERGGSADEWNSLLVYAVVQDRPQIVKELMKLPLDVNSLDRNGYTPLLYAIDRDHVKVTKELLKAGANANVLSKEGVSPLISAVTRGKQDMVAELLKAGADRSVLSPSGETAIGIAQKRNRDFIIGLLMEKIEAAAY